MAKASGKVPKHSAAKKRASGVPVDAKPAKTTQSQPRRRKLERYTSFRMHRRIRTHLPPLPGSLALSKRAVQILRSNWRMFGTLIAIYALASLILVRGFNASFNVPEVKTALGSIVGGKLAVVTVTASVYGVILGTLGTVGTATGATYQSILLVVMTLATIWSLRTVMNGEQAPIREAFYRGMYPLMVFLTVIVIIGVQLLPIIVGAWLYNVLIGGGILISGFEKACGLILFLLLAVLSLYMITSSLFALFISTIPNMSPLTALRSARQLVAHRRLTVLSRVLALVFILPLAAGVVMVPFILFVPLIAEWVFFVISHVGSIFIVTYLYLLYKELLNE